jgi:hypothetical protein
MGQRSLAPALLPDSSVTKPGACVTALVHLLIDAGPMRCCPEAAVVMLILPGL